MDFASFLSFVLFLLRMSSVFSCHRADWPAPHHDSWRRGWAVVRSERPSAFPSSWAPPWRTWRRKCSRFCRDSSPGIWHYSTKSQSSPESLSRRMERDKLPESAIEFVQWTKSYSASGISAKVNKVNFVRYAIHIHIHWSFRFVQSKISK